MHNCDQGKKQLSSNSTYHSCDKEGKEQRVTRELNSTAIKIRKTTLITSFGRTSDQPHRKRCLRKKGQDSTSNERRRGINQPHHFKTPFSPVGNEKFLSPQAPNVCVMSVLRNRRSTRSYRFYRQISMKAYQTGCLDANNAKLKISGFETSRNVLTSVY